jgi:diaminopimelate epimerase
MGLRFSKMHGAGNDFVVLDLRHGEIAPSAALAAAIGDRHTGVGFDQLLTIEKPQQPGAIARYRIWNSDGSAAQQCGNGARCVAAWLVRDGAATAATFTLESPAGRVDVEHVGDGRYSLDLGVPDFDPARIPMAPVGASLLATSSDEYTATVNGRALRFGAASMGNPHALVVVDDVATAPVAELGPALQVSGLFPQGVNVGFAQIVARDDIRLRVFERGAGETLACGSGACAALAILVRQGRVDRLARVRLPGGILDIAWPRDDAPVRMAGPAVFVFEGEWLG